MMTGCIKRLWLSGLMVAAITLMASTAMASDLIRVTMAEVPGGGTDAVKQTLQEIEELEVHPSDWFYQQVRGRAFQPAGVTNRSSDMMWVMRGSSIDIVVDFVTEDEDEYLVRLLTRAEGLPEHEFHVDRGEDGPTRGALRLLRTEVERFIGAGPAPPPVVEVDEDSREAREAQAEDPDVVRQRRAEEEAALAQRLQRDWLWARLNFRLFRKDFVVDGRNAVYSWTSGSFPGFELDIEAFPFSLTNSDMMEAGVYVTYNHGFDGLTIIDESADPPEQLSLTVNNFSIEGGAIYRLDSPLDENNRQLRFKVGARYEAFSIPENPVYVSTGIVSLVLGTRLVLPVDLVGDEFAVTAAVDVVPFAAFGAGGETFGQTSFSYGFGSELGFVYEVANNFFLSAGYGFRLVRSSFTGDGEGQFTDSDAFDLNQGLRAGVVYQY